MSDFALSLGLVADLATVCSKLSKIDRFDPIVHKALLRVAASADLWRLIEDVPVRYSDGLMRMGRGNRSSARIGRPEIQRRGVSGK